VCVGTGRTTEAKQRMLEQGEQGYGSKPTERSLSRKAREHAGGGVREPVAAGVVGYDTPAVEGRHHATGERAIRRDEGGRRLRLLERLSQRDRDSQCLFLGVRGFDHR